MSLFVGCRAEETALPSVLDAMLMAAAVESADDAADDQAAEEPGDFSVAFGVTSGVGGALTVGCVTVTTDPDPLPSVRPAHFAVTWTFSDCRWRGFTQSGTRSIDFTLNTDGSRDFVGARDLMRTRPLGDVVALDSTGTMHATGTRASGSVTRAITYQEHRVRTRPSGDVVFDVDVASDDLTVVTTFAALDQEVTRVFDGTVTTSGNDRDFELTSTLDGVTRQPATCCHPIAGTVSQQLRREGELLRSRTFAFTETCGVVTADDGATIQLPGCI